MKKLTILLLILLAHTPVSAGKQRKTKPHSHFWLDEFERQRRASAESAAAEQEPEQENIGPEAAEAAEANDFALCVEIDQHRENLLRILCKIKNILSLYFTDPNEIDPEHQGELLQEIQLFLTEMEALEQLLQQNDMNVPPWLQAQVEQINDIMAELNQAPASAAQDRHRETRQRYARPGLPRSRLMSAPAGSSSGGSEIGLWSLKPRRHSAHAKMPTSIKLNPRAVSRLVELFSNESFSTSIKELGSQNNRGAVPSRCESECGEDPELSVIMDGFGKLD